ncbi:MAG: ABC transporter ATP-binding protein [Alphaproteobacteria bacterium]|nr:ABC transporter ATP-binding protein [Alphaproteobacteria bacterium]
MALLSVRGLKTQFALRDRTITPVDGVDLEVEPGETTAIVGESGSGKSVFALSIMRLLPTPPATITGGQVLFEGRDLLTMDERDLRAVRGAKLAMIFQEPMTALNPVLTVGRQLTEAMERHRGLTPRQATARAGDLLKMVEIPDAAARLRAFPHQFSGGMRQRVMIAMALSCEPRLVIADEPTTALDVTTQAEILDLVRRLCRDTGTAMILITHDLGVVARYASRVNVMYAGRLVEQGPAEALYGRPLHPYTRGLLASVPRVDRPLAKLQPIKGTPPDPAKLPPGCAFAPRCELAIERCRGERPGLELLLDNRRAACWRATEVLAEASP